MKNFIAILISVISLTPLAAHAQWMQTSLPDIGDVTALTIDGSNILAGSIVGTIYCSSDSGTNWTLSFNNTDQHEVHNFILLGDKIITSCMGQGLFLSQDSGARWLNINSDLPYESAVAFAFKDGYLFAADDYYNSSGDSYPTGVYSSNDSGVSWTSVSSGLNFSNRLSALVVIDTDLFVASNGVYRSTDNGTNWILSSPAWPYVQTLAVLGATLFAGTLDSGIYRSTDHGTHWVQSNSGLQNSAVLNLLVWDTLIFAGTSNGVFVSADSGITWVEKDTGLVQDGILTLAVNGAYLFAGTSKSGVWRCALSEKLGYAGVTTNADAGALEVSLDGNRLYVYSGSNSIQVRISNILGAETLAQHGSGTVDVDLSPLPAGVYLALVEAGNQRVVKKITVVH